MDTADRRWMSRGLRHPKRLAGWNEDKQWHGSDAVILGDAVIVSLTAVPNPMAVQFAFSMKPHGVNLVDKRAGSPASPFRRDVWRTDLYLAALACRRPSCPPAGCRPGRHR